MITERAFVRGGLLAKLVLSVLDAVKVAAVELPCHHVFADRVVHTPVPIRLCSALDDQGSQGLHNCPILLAPIDAFRLAGLAHVRVAGFDAPPLTALDVAIRRYLALPNGSG